MIIWHFIYAKYIFFLFGIKVKYDLGMFLWESPSQGSLLTPLTDSPDINSSLPCLEPFYSTHIFCQSSCNACMFSFLLFKSFGNCLWDLWPSCQAIVADNELPLLMRCAYRCGFTVCVWSSVSHTENTQTCISLCGEEKHTKAKEGRNVMELCVCGLHTGFPISNSGKKASTLIFSHQSTVCKLIQYVIAGVKQFRALSQLRWEGGAHWFLCQGQ